MRRLQRRPQLLRHRSPRPASARQLLPQLSLQKLSRILALLLGGAPRDRDGTAEGPRQRRGGGGREATPTRTQSTRARLHRSR